MRFWLGRVSGRIFNDYEKFFDTLDIETLISEAIDSMFPLDALVLALEQHLAPRILQVGGCSSKAIRVFQSILAGCKTSKALTAVYLKRGMTSISKDKDANKANLSLFIDDTCFHALADTVSLLLDKFMPDVLKFQMVARKLKLKLSPKTQITTSCELAAILLQKELKEYGMFFEISKQAQDLGVSFSAARCRPNKLLVERSNNVKKSHLKYHF